MQYRVTFDSGMYRRKLFQQHTLETGMLLFKSHFNSACWH